MKKTYILILGALAALTSCGMIAQSSSSDDGHRFQDGIYSSSPSFRSKDEKTAAKAETEALISKTKESPIYLFGDRKDTIMIPDNFSARIQYDQKVGGTVVTVGENPYDWRWDLENRYGYWYSPYSIGSSWYWSRHYNPLYSPYHSPYWSYSPWRYCSFYDPWYYDPWYYDPWYYGGYWGGYYAGYWGWHDPWHHYHHHHHHGWYDPHPPVTRPSHPGGSGSKNRYYGPRAHTEKGHTYAGASAGPSGSSGRTGISRTSGGGTMRGSISVGNRTSRTVSTTSRSGSSTSRSGSSPTYRKPASSGGGSSGYSRSSSSNNKGSSYSRSSSRESSSSSSSYDRSSSSSYSRSSSGSYSRSSSSGSSSYSRSSSSGGGGYSRSSSGSYRR